MKIRTGSLTACRRTMLGVSGVNWHGPLSPALRRLRFDPLEQRRLLTAYLVNPLAAVDNANDVVALHDVIEAANTYAQDGDAQAGGSLGDETASCAPALVDGGPITTQVGNKDVPLIRAGDHTLLPDTPGQEIEIWISGGQTIEGINFSVQIANGGPEAAIEGFIDAPGIDGPSITNVDLETGTIFALNNTGQVNQASNETFPQLFGAFIVTDANTVVADGLLATVTVDTTGFAGGSWTLNVDDTLAGPTSIPFVGQCLQDGSLTIPGGSLVNAAPAHPSTLSTASLPGNGLSTPISSAAPETVSHVEVSSQDLIATHDRVAFVNLVNILPVPDSQAGFFEELQVFALSSEVEEAQGSAAYDLAWLSEYSQATTSRPAKKDNPDAVIDRLLATYWP